MLFASAMFKGKAARLSFAVKEPCGLKASAMFKLAFMFIALESLSPWSSGMTSPSHQKGKGRRSPVRSWPGSYLAKANSIMKNTSNCDIAKPQLSVGRQFDPGRAHEELRD